MCKASTSLLISLMVAGQLSLSVVQADAIAADSGEEIGQVAGFRQKYALHIVVGIRCEGRAFSDGGVIIKEYSARQEAGEPSCEIVDIDYGISQWLMMIQGARERVRVPPSLEAGGRVVVF